MKKKLISSIVLAGMIAFGAQADDFAGSIYIKDAIITPGGTTRLSVQLTNDVEIRDDASRGCQLPLLEH